MQDRKFTFESCGDTNWVFRFLALPCFLDKELCFLWLWQGSPAKTTSGSQNSRGGLPRLSWGCLLGRFQAVSRLFPCCLHAVSRLSPGLFLVFLPFLNFKSVLIVSFYFLFACQSAISHGFVPLRLAIPLTCEEATAVTFYRSSWLRKLACCWCLNVWLPYITV